MSVKNVSVSSCGEEWKRHAAIISAFVIITAIMVVTTIVLCRVVLTYADKPSILVVLYVPYDPSLMSFIGVVIIAVGITFIIIVPILVEDEVEDERSVIVYRIGGCAFLVMGIILFLTCTNVPSSAWNVVDRFLPNVDYVLSHAYNTTVQHAVYLALAKMYRLNVDTVEEIAYLTSAKSCLHVVESTPIYVVYRVDLRCLLEKLVNATGLVEKIGIYGTCLGKSTTLRDYMKCVRKQIHEKEQEKQLVQYISRIVRQAR